MPKHSEKQARQAAAQEEIARRRRQTEAESPLTRAQLDALLDHLAEAIVEDGHDDDTSITRRWLDLHGVDPDPVLAFLSKRRLHNDFDIALAADPNTLFGPTSDRRARMPIPQEALEALIAWVDAACKREGCDHSLRHTRAWLTANRQPIATTEIALLAQGGGCDCEVVLNVDMNAIYPPQAGQAP